MMRSNDNIFMIEYIKNVLYFATVRQDKELKSTNETHYFSIDNELVYENYYGDFGPLNLGCVYKYCKLLNEKLKYYLNKQTIVHYTSIDPKKKANAAFLLGCYGVLYLSLTPKDAMKPLLARGTTYRPFQDATQGEPEFTITILDCLKAIKKASDLGFFNFKDFNYEEYERLDKIAGGDLNWIVPGKFLAFIGPVDCSVSLYHPPEMYIDYFKENHVEAVIRLNKRLYDAKVFDNAGIKHYDLFFTDGSCPPRHILFKFLQISEDTPGALAVHCKAGLGRTGSLIGSYLIKHYRMTACEAIGWMRICRPGSVIGHQQAWLQQLEAWLMKQGNIYRKRNFHDTEKFPSHAYGVYSIAEKTNRRRPVVFEKSPSPPPPMHRYVRSDISPPPRPQASKIREDKAEGEDEERFLNSCDLTVNQDAENSVNYTKIRGCVIQNNTTAVNEIDLYGDDRYAPIKMEKDGFVKNSKTDSNSKISHKGDHIERASNSARRSGAGDPRLIREGSNASSRASTRNSPKPNNNELIVRKPAEFYPGATARTTVVPLLKTVNEAKSFLMRSSAYTNERLNQLKSSITVTPHVPRRALNIAETRASGTATNFAPYSFSTAAHGSTLPSQRRRLGRSPSPSPPRPPCIQESTRATNTPTPRERMMRRDMSKTALNEALSRLKVVTGRNGSNGAGSVGVASLGARRDAPLPKRAPSARSDERAVATQGDMLNSIKLQRRYRETLEKDKSNRTFNSKFVPREKLVPPRGIPNSSRPSSPKGRRIVQNTLH